MHLPPPPDTRTLLPPLLACLPTAFISLRPPPALLPLLSPVLRQRLSFLLSTSASNSRSDSWLPLLSWDSTSGEKLPALVERMQLEPHPVSGELELEDLRPAKYRRLDEETLHARFEVEEFGIGVVYVWCEEGDSLQLDLESEASSGEAGSGWKLADLKPLEDILGETSREEGEWHDSIASANAAAPPTPSAQQNLLSVPDTPGTLRNGSYRSSPGLGSEDEYWAAYDRTPGPEQQSPQHTTRAAPSAARQGVGRQRSQSQLEYFARYGADSPAPTMPSLQPLTAFHRSQGSGRQRAQSEFDYFSRYGSEVQPALDPEDPDEAAQLPAAANSRGAALGGYKSDWRIPNSGLGLSTSHDSVMHSHSHSYEYLQPQPQPQRDPLPRADSRPTGASLYPADPRPASSETTKFPSLDPNSRSAEEGNRRISAPRAISPTKSSSQDSIENLERRARAISEAEAEASRTQSGAQPISPHQPQTHQPQEFEPCDLAQTAIKAHISTDIKSLFRLARKTGIDRADFERIVRTELEFLGMLEQEG